MSTSAHPEAGPPAIPASPSRRTRLLLSWRLWLVLLFTSLCLIAFSFCMPVYRRMQAFDYLDAHEISYDLTDDNAWMTERFGRWGRGFRRVNRVSIGGLSMIDDFAIPNIAEFREIREFIHYRTAPYSERSIDALTALNQVERITLEGAIFTDELLARWFSHQPPLNRVLLLETPIADDGLLELSRISTLESLSMRGMTFTDGDFRGLPPPRSLQSLDISGGTIGSQSGNWIGRMPALDYLALERSEVSSDFWKELADGSRVTCITIGECSLPEQSLRNLSFMSNLTALSIRRSTFDDAELQYLALMHQLADLRIENCVDVSDKGVRHLGTAADLEILSLVGCSSLTDACIAELEGMPRLRSLNLPHTLITLASIESLRKIPNLDHIYVESERSLDENLRLLLREIWSARQSRAVR